MKYVRSASWLLQQAALLPNHGHETEVGDRTPGFSSHAAKALRVLTLKLGFDPPCKVQVAGMQLPLLLPLSHQLPFYRSRHPYYDRLPGLLATYLRETRGSLYMIDVGANVGDTILSTFPGTTDHYLALEPHPDFFPYLVANTSVFSNVVRLQVACGESEGRLGFADSAKGTAASVDVGKPGYEVLLRPLDTIWAGEWGGGRVDFLKIDTDGFDVSVLLGASRLLREQQPWVLYECDVFLTEGGIGRHLEVLRELSCLGYLEMICYDNLGNCLGAYRLREDGDVLRDLLGEQSQYGSVRYQDMLLIPAGESAQSFLQGIGSCRQIPRRQTKAASDHRFQA